MKRMLMILLMAALLFLSACGKNAAASPLAQAPSPTPSPTLDSGSSNLPGGTSKPSQTDGAQTPAPTGEKKSDLYDPSIFIIQASGNWKDEIAKGYFANYECEIYLHKIDSNNNRVSSGSYQGFFWMNMELDTEEFIQDMLKDVPVEAQFNAGGEAICDNLGISLSTEDDKAWVDYSILDDNGNPLPLTRDTPVAKGSFVAVSKGVYLDAMARGAQGEKVDYQANSDGDTIDVNYVIHVQPDASESGNERKVVIHLSIDGTNVTLNGTMKRISGYPEDVLDYANSNQYQDSLQKHLN